MVLALVLVLLAVSDAVSYLLGLPSSLGFPPAVRGAGVGVAAVGTMLGMWTIALRGPLSMITSTYVTLSRGLGRAPSRVGVARTEPLVVGGPQKYTRNPLYLGVVVILLGLALATASSAYFVATVVFFLWFVLVLIPFEERELKAIFGEEWERYSAETPMLFPSTGRRMRRRSPGTTRSEREL